MLDVVVLTIRPEMWRRARKSLDAQKVAYRGILVNHSPEHIESDAQWRVLGDGRNHSYAHGLNQTFRFLTGERVLFLSDDAVLGAGALPAMLRHSDPIVGCTLVADGTVNHLGGGFTETRHPFHHGRGTQPVESDCPLVDWVTWACVLLDQTVINRVGLVDEGFWYSHEDVDYVLRAREAGFPKPRLCTEAVVEHPEQGYEQAPRASEENVTRYKSKWVESGRLERVLAP